MPHPEGPAAVNLSCAFIPPFYVHLSSSASKRTGCQRRQTDWMIFILVHLD